MATFNGPVYLAPKASTGNNTHTAVASGPEYDAYAVQFVIEAIGATPTVTFKVQGSLDGTNWFDSIYITDATDTPAVAALTKTTVGAFVIFLDLPAVRVYPFLRVVTSANTNVTYRCELYATNQAS